MLQFDLFDFRNKEHQRMVGKVNSTAWMVQDRPDPSTLGKRLRKRVRRS